MSKTKKKTTKKVAAKGYTKAMSLFKKKTEAALAKVQNPEELKKKHEVIKYIFDTADWVFTQQLDAVPEHTLVRYGGKMTGAYVFIGTLANEARLKRDIYVEKREEIINELTVQKYFDSEKITLARAEAKKEAAVLNDFIIAADYEKNNFETLVYACDKTVSFLQSAIKVKQGERYKDKQLGET